MQAIERGRRAREEVSAMLASDEAPLRHASTPEDAMESVERAQKALNEIEVSHCCRSLI